MQVHLVRHGCAGHKSDWSGEDAKRPLDPAGRRQSAALADVLEEVGVMRLISSPTARCVETLVPFGRRVGLQVETDDRLARDADVETLLCWAGSPELENAALCTHGELLKPVLDALRAADIDIEAARLDDDWLLGKGTAWMLAGADGRVDRLVHLAPMPVEVCPAHSSPVA